MALPTPPEENKILKNCQAESKSSENVINFQRQNSEGVTEDVKVRVVYTYHNTPQSVVQYQDGSEWKAFEDTDVRKISLEDVLAENNKRDLAYANELKNALDGGEKVGEFGRCCMNN
jgi:hypothetical protein